MPRSTRKRISSPVEVPEEREQSDQEMEEEQVEEEEEADTGAGYSAANASARLQFKQTLNWRAGKPIQVADLLRRLETLARELQGYEQDEVAPESLQTTAKELANPQLLTHKDKGVKALTACCVVDVFRLCAPNAPYTQQQMKNIFSLIVKDIFPSLADPSSAYNRQHLHVLKSLAEVKSIILLTDTPGSGTLIEVLFKECFDVLGGPSRSNSNEELSKNVEHHMTVVLSTLVDETDALPGEVTNTILAQFLRTSPKVAAAGAKGKKAAQTEELQGTLSLKEAPPAYNMAKNICNALPDKMARHITRYWSGVVAEHQTSLQNGTSSYKKGKRRVSDDADGSDDEMAKNASEDLKEIVKVHDLLRELWRATPNVLRDIIPLLDNELSEENIQKRQLAVETVGDMIAGIGHAGPPSATQLNPAAYPSQSLIDPSERNKVYDFLTTPTSPISFVSRYHQIYQAFLARRHDKSAVVRAAWATAVGRILLTSAGGVGLSTEEEQAMSKAFADCLMDVDEKVRHNAVKVIEHFDYDDIVQKLGNQGGVDDEGSILANLAERVKDRKKDVRNDALRLLGKIWGVAVGAIGEGSERTTKLLGSIPSKILGTYYLNDPEISMNVDRLLFDSLLPLSYPPIKSKPATNGNSQRSLRQSQAGDAIDVNPDKLRTERILLLVKSLDERGKQVFFALTKKQVGLAKYMSLFLEACEKYNGGVAEDDEADAKARVTKMVEAHTKFLPDGPRVTDDMWKFAKAHDRRSYALIRFCMAAESDYKKVKNAYFELTKKLEDMEKTSPTFVETITILVLRASVLVYNRSHVQAIIEFSRSDENGLGATAHEVLGMISKDKPEVFKAHVQELCKSLEAEAPSAKRPNEPGAVQDLKACAQFARQFPKDVPKDRKFIQALFSFINHGTPPEAAKYGALIILLVADKKQMYAKDILKQCTEGFEYGKGNFLGRLAALGQLMLLGSEYLEEEETDVVVGIAINDVLTNADSTPAPIEGETDPDWSDEPDNDSAAKIWALKLLVNRLRAFPDGATLDDAAKPVFQFLNTLVQKGGQISRNQPSLAAHQSRMRLVAAQMLLKLCREKHLSSRLSAAAFNSLAVVAMDPRPQVRSGFVNKIMKYLGQVKLSNKFFAPLFLLGHEPDRGIKSGAMTWLRARAISMAGGKTRDTAMEATFARLLSLLAHHPDWPTPPIDEDELIQSLKEFMGYILFYLQCVSTKDNLSLVYHVAQRVKGHQDGIVDPKNEELLQTMNERLYMLSDLSQAVIRRYLDYQGWTLQAWPGRVKLPAGIFALIGDHDTAQTVAMKNYLPQDLEEGLDEEVRNALKSKKVCHFPSFLRSQVAVR
jgi:sister-chromatid-cohesion protein PDS5